VYRILPRTDLYLQVMETIKRHAGEAVIIYCISRKDTEEMAGWLKSKGIAAEAYHAGLDAATRTGVQEAFAAERIDVVVATVAFGMGIDRSNVRCVIHAALPKSVEAYQQETGRAGRDGLEAECILFYAARDFRSWEFLITRAAEEQHPPPEQVEAQMELLRDMQNLAAGSQCRHRALSRYFGQDYDQKNCGACDICLEEREAIPESTELAKTLLGGVQALRRPFGIAYVVDVLCGARGERIERNRHNTLPEYGAFKAAGKPAVRDLLQQLIDQGYLDRSEAEYPVLSLTHAGQQVLRGREEVTLRKPAGPAPAPTAVEAVSWQGVDRGLFEYLRDLRRRIADERKLPAFTVFNDAVLRELARIRPADSSAMRRVKGIGEQKLSDLGPAFLDAIVRYCRAHALPTNQLDGTRLPVTATLSKARVYEMFAEGCSLEEVAAASGRAPSTVAGYLEDYIGERRPASIEPWVEPKVYDRVKAAALKSEGALLRPVFEALAGEIPYEQIRIVMKHAGLR
jgi:ATP-dependent DNA helicase RecQ